MRRKATPRGYKHVWGYKGVWNETKVTPKQWRFTFNATKGKRSKSYGSFKPGFRVRWKINAIQDAIKTGKGTYQTKMRGTKRLMFTGDKR